MSHAAFLISDGFSREATRVATNPTETHDLTRAIEALLGGMSRHTDQRHPGRVAIAVLEDESLNPSPSRSPRSRHPLDVSSPTQNVAVLFKDVDTQQHRILIELLSSLFTVMDESRAEAAQAALRARVQALTLLYPPVTPQKDGLLERIEDALALQREFMQTERVLTSEEVADSLQSKSKNRAALASKWRTAGRIFAVPYQGKEYFPAFQFLRTGQPHPWVAPLLTILRSDPQATEWDIATWFTSATDWLSGDVPKELLTRQNPADRERLTFAAHQDVAAAHE